MNYIFSSFFLKSPYLFLLFALLFWTTSLYFSLVRHSVEDLNPIFLLSKFLLKVLYLPLKEICLLIIYISVFVVCWLWIVLEKCNSEMRLFSVTESGEWSSVLKLLSWLPIIAFCKFAEVHLCLVSQFDPLENDYEKYCLSTPKISVLTTYISSKKKF